MKIERNIATRCTAKKIKTIIGSKNVPIEGTDMTRNIFITDENEEISRVFGMGILLEKVIKNNSISAKVYDPFGDCYYTNAHIEYQKKAYIQISKIDVTTMVAFTAKPNLYRKMDDTMISLKIETVSEIDAESVEKWKKEVSNDT